MVFLFHSTANPDEPKRAEAKMFSRVRTFGLMPPDIGLSGSQMPFGSHAGISLINVILYYKLL